VQAREFEGTPREQRYELLRIVTEENPIFKPGEDFEYSNAGPYIAASMMEKEMDQTWESMMEELLLKPLQMGNTTPLRSLQRGSSPQLTAPGGGIHSSMEDFAKFCIFHMQFKPGNALGIKRKDFEKMHEASGDSNYGLGFFAITRNWSKGTTY
jgi:CubicO group peptidase (beta-lactamase class C family)